MNQMVVKGLKCTLILSLVVFIGACGHSPIRNPFKSQPKVVLGPLPELKEQTEAKIVWQQRTTRGAGDYAKIRPEIGQDVIYQADLDGVIVAIDKAKGKRLWRKMTKYPIASGPTLIDGKLFIGTRDGHVVAFNPTTGQEIWAKRVPSEVLAPPQGNDKVLLVNTIDGQLTALNTQDGKTLWHYQRVIPALTLRGGSKPLLASGQALAGFASGKFVALDVKTGSMAWERTITVPSGRSELHRMVDVNANPIIHGDIVFVAAYQGNISAIELSSGRVLWQHQVSAYKDITADNLALYVTDNESQVWAFDQKTGQTLWKQTGLKRRRITGPELAHDYLVVGDHGGYVHWLDKSNGQILGRYSLGHRILQRPVAEENFVLVTAQNGAMSALELEPK